MKEIIPTHQAFINHYIKLGNIKQASEKAKLSYSHCRHLIRQPHIQEKIRELQRAAEMRAAKASGITKQRVLLEEEHIAFFDPLPVLKMIKFKNPDPATLPEEIRRVIASIELKRNKDGSVLLKCKFWDKGKALERLERHLGMYEKDNDQKRDQVNIYPDPRIDKGEAFRTPEEIVELMTGNGK